VPWLRVGDTFAHDPRTTAPTAERDPRLVNELAGFVVRCASEAAAHVTDFRIDYATIVAVAGGMSEAERLITLAVKYKLFTASGDDAWALVDDPKYLHMRSKTDVENDNVRSRDSRNDALYLEALLRDGDNCRFCGCAAVWYDQKTGRGRTMEHININNQPTRLHEYVVCCRHDQNNPERPALLPAPKDPVYGRHAQAEVKKRTGRSVRALLNERSRSTAAPKPSGQRTTGERPDFVSDTAPETTQQQPDNTSENAPDTNPGVRPTSQVDNAPTGRTKPLKPDRSMSRVSERMSSGRVGSLQVPAGSGQTVPARPADPSTRKRKPRGKPKPTTKGSSS
jgi:hypothetical protein